MDRFITGDSVLGDASDWAIPTVRCVMCGHQGIEDLELRPVSDNPGGPGTLQHVCTGCGGNWDAACQEAAADEGVTNE